LFVVSDNGSYTIYVSAGAPWFNHLCPVIDKCMIVC
jgi:hypothetical protein